ncbi:hypothetical protein J6590_069499 [Homalodisca vitripennis]|nr:hypothetical protein J6590_069499 [Homalodisca vitripennis]
MAGGRMFIVSRRANDVYSRALSLPVAFRKGFIVRKTCASKPALHPDLCFEMCHTQQTYA